MLNHPTFASWPSFTDEEANAVHKVLMSNKVNYWTGDEGRKFESEFAEWCGTKYAIAVSNGTLALELSLRAIGILPGDEVIVTPRTFIASVSCIVNVGAIPVFADVDIISGNITAKTISSKITQKTRAIICVHLAGWPCDMDPIIDLGKSHNIKIIEDCAQAHGAQYKGRSVGGIGDVAAWSFCQDKIMTTGGEGGMVTTNNKALWLSMWAYKDHGKSYEAVYERKHPVGYKWLHESFGTNYRMLEIQACIGRIQLKKMPQWNQIRNKYAKKIHESCAKFPAIRPTIFRCNSCGCDNLCATSSGCTNAFYKCYIYLDLKALKKGWTRDRVITEITNLGVPCMQGVCPEVYLEKSIAQSGLAPDNRLPIAKELGDISMMFLVHPTLNEHDIDNTCDAIEKVITLASN